MDICKSLSFLRIRKNFAAILVNLGKIAFAFIKNRQNFLAQALLTILGCKGGAETALFRESDLKTCIEAGCNDYLVKPFTFQELQEKIKEFIPIPKATIH